MKLKGKSNKQEEDASRFDLSEKMRALLLIEGNPKYLGVTARELAGMTGIGLGWVEKLRASEPYKRALSDLSRPALDVLRAAKKKAAVKLIRLIDSADDRVAVKACVAILGKDLEAKTQPTENRDLTLTIAKPVAEMTTEELRDAAADEMQRIMADDGAKGA